MVIPQSPASKRRSWRSLLEPFPVVAIGGGTIVLSNNTAVQNIESQKQAAALELSNTLNAFLFERYSDIEALSNLPSFSDSKIIASQTAAQKSALLTKYADTYGIYDSIAAFDLNGDVIAQSRGPKLPNHANRSYFPTGITNGAAGCWIAPIFKIRWCVCHVLCHPIERFFGQDYWGDSSSNADEAGS